MRYRSPDSQKNEYLGIVVESLGARRMRVLCEDNNIRICSIPKNHAVPFIHKDSCVIVKAWDVQSDTKGRIVYRYNREQSNRLRGLLL